MCNMDSIKRRSHELIKFRGRTKAVNILYTKDHRERVLILNYMYSVASLLIRHVTDPRFTEAKWRRVPITPLTSAWATLECVVEMEENVCNLMAFLFLHEIIQILVDQFTTTKSNVFFVSCRECLPPSSLPQSLLSAFLPAQCLLPPECSIVYQIYDSN